MHTDVTAEMGSSRRTAKKDRNIPVLSRVIFLALVCVFAPWSSSSCTANTVASGPVNLPKLPPGTKVDASLPYFKYWPGGRPAMFVVRSNLVLAVPPQYQPFWYPHVKLFRGPAPISAIPKNQRSGVAFQFFLPDFTGYTPENYRKTFDPDRVNVIELQPADPKEVEFGAAGEYPPNMMRRALKGLLNPVTRRRIYGLTCYQFSHREPGVGNRLLCWGRDVRAGGNYVMIDVSLPPYESWMKFPTMQARYFTPGYGGLRVVWRASAKNFPHWQEIDAHMWEFVKAWNVSRNKMHNTGSR